MTQWNSLGTLKFPLSKVVPAKFQGSGGHSKCNYSQDRANFHRSRAWQIVLNFNTEFYIARKYVMTWAHFMQRTQTRLFVRETTGDRWIPLAKGRWCEQRRLSVTTFSCASPSGSQRRCLYAFICNKLSNCQRFGSLCRSSDVTNEFKQRKQCQQRTSTVT